jgi:hypothetical protein
MIKQMKKSGKQRQRDISLVCANGKPINIRITLIAGHWTLYGSVMIRFENFPIAYNGNSFEADFSLMLLEPIRKNHKTTTDMIDLNALNAQIADSEAFESWLKEQVADVWNN